MRFQSSLAWYYIENHLLLDHLTKLWQAIGALYVCAPAYNGERLDTLFTFGFELNILRSKIHYRWTDCQWVILFAHDHHASLDYRQIYLGTHAIRVCSDGYFMTRTGRLHLPCSE